MERWEYHVIHLNVEPSAPAPPAAPPSGVEPAAGTPPIRGEAIFSKEYLEKEFPGFYGDSPPEGAPARKHPANQLRGFLNLQGREGWQLLGFYPVGRLQMMIFRRPLLPAAGGEQAAAMSSRQAAVPAPAPMVDTPEASVPPPPDLEPQAPVLERILSRLEALERRLPPPQSAVAGSPTVGGALAALQDGEILPADRCSDLDGLPRLSTPEAARALGFRSATSLLNLAARGGYRQGLVKRGVNGAVAIYMGSEKSGRGGRNRRLWVVPQAAPR